MSESTTTKKPIPPEHCSHRCALTSNGSRRRARKAKEAAHFLDAEGLDLVAMDL